MKGITDIIAGFSGISLEEMDSVALMNRTDTKHITSLANALEILKELSADYRILTLDGRRIFRYRTTYFDTPDRFMLHEHLRGKLNRFKIRSREYLDSGITFLEVKRKTNKGRAIKSRMIRDSDAGSISDSESAFLQESCPIGPACLKPSVLVEFTRITLANTAFKERVTFDTGLSFSVEGRKQTTEDLVIIELKKDSDHASRTPIVSVLKSHHARPYSLSKYCIGMILLDQTTRYNRYKPKLLNLNRLSSHGNIW